MSYAIIDTLLVTLADIQRRDAVTFDLDSANRVLESAQAGLETATPDEKRSIKVRAKALALESNDPRLIAFLATLVVSLG